MTIIIIIILLLLFVVVVMMMMIDLKDLWFINKYRYLNYHKETAI